MAKKYTLPVLSDVLGGTDEGNGRKRPSVDIARAKLGGRTANDEQSLVFTTGQHVSFERAPGERVHAVVLHGGAGEVHVLVDAARVRRVAPGELAAEPGTAPGALEEIARDARVFGMLVEGQVVRYADPAGTLQDGKLVERCRYGALVLRDDGVVVAVGFRKLWPGNAGDAPS